MSREDIGRTAEEESGVVYAEHIPRGPITFLDASASASAELLGLHPVRHQEELTIMDERRAKQASFRELEQETANSARDSMIKRLYPSVKVKMKGKSKGEVLKEEEPESGVKVQSLGGSPEEHSTLISNIVSVLKELDVEELRRASGLIRSLVGTAIYDYICDEAKRERDIMLKTLKRSMMGAGPTGGTSMPGGRADV